MHMNMVNEDVEDIDMDEKVVVDEKITTQKSKEKRDVVVINIYFQEKLQQYLIIKLLNFILFRF